MSTYPSLPHFLAHSTYRQWRIGWNAERRAGTSVLAMRVCESMRVGCWVGRESSGRMRSSALSCAETTQGAGCCWLLPQPFLCPNPSSKIAWFLAANFKTRVGSAISWRHLKSIMFLSPQQTKVKSIWERAAESQKDTSCMVNQLKWM